MTKPFAYPGYARFWGADTVSTFGTYITTVAMPTLAVVVLKASDTQVGLLNGARWTPYLLFGLLAGVVADRYRRRPILVATDLVRGTLLAVVAVLAAIHIVDIYELTGFVFVFGALSLLYDAAHQSYLPRLVPPTSLTVANARLEQTTALAQTTGPFLGGSLVAALGAPLSMVIDAVSYLASGLTLATIRVPEPVPHAESRNLRNELREGLRFVYKQPIMRAYALTLHARFFFASIIGTVFTLFVLRDLGAGSPRAAFGLGLVLAAGGAGAVIGNGMSQRLGRNGVGRIMVAERVAEPFAWSLAALALNGAAGWAMVAAAQFFAWLALGASGPNEMAYRQSATPDRLQGRVNATVRSLNWGTITFGAPIGGLLAQHIGYRPAMWVGIGGMAVAGVIALLSPMRRARVTERLGDGVGGADAAEVGVGAAEVGAGEVGAGAGEAAAGAGAGAGASPPSPSPPPQR
ncbi:MFS transporter [Catenulispora sp. NL8]|uniref:MFS transporter n=1 Tax=Catenulispora pinistramenti TaxID=2705254 RepID=A0ABS5L5K8_9ACTN|nr:MFS transporter [Catenulispora pinistramenti]MBS2553632.1 MFS transporter [Catenulispora pinistramenti]